MHYTKLWKNYCSCFFKLIFLKSIKLVGNIVAESGLAGIDGLIEDNITGFGFRIKDMWGLGLIELTVEGFFVVVIGFQVTFGVVVTFVVTYGLIVENEAGFVIVGGLLWVVLVEELQGV